MKPSRPLIVLAAAGAAALAAGVAAAPDRAWASLLVAGYALTCAGLAGTFFIALHYACGASWAVALRRIPEAMSAVLPFGAAAVIAVLIFRPSLYPWTAHLEHAEGFRALWLNRPFFLARAAVYIALWLLFTRLLVRTSRRQDTSGDIGETRRNTRYSVIFLPVFALTFWLAGVDWVMSLEPAWVSTIFGVYQFAGMFSAGLAIIVLLALWLRNTGPLQDFITGEHMADLGKLLFAFSTFWMYIWFSQYMLIWYANMTEETVYYVLRQKGVLGPLMVVNVVLNWGVPFLALISKPAKRNAAIMGSVAAVVLAGRALDLYLMILPPVTGGAAPLPWIEAGAVALAAAVFVLVFRAAFRRAPEVPVRDPLLAQSLHYHSS